MTFQTAPDVIEAFHDDLRELCEKHPNMHDRNVLNQLIALFNATIFSTTNFKYKDVQKNTIYNMLKTHVDRRLKFLKMAMIIILIGMATYFMILALSAFDFFHHDRFFYDGHHPIPSLHTKEFIMFKIILTGIMFVIPSVFMMIYLLHNREQYTGVNHILSHLISKQKID